MRDSDRPREYEPEYRVDGEPTRPPDRGAPDEGDEPGGPPGYRPTEDYSEPSRNWKSLQIGCGAVIVVAIVLAIVIPVFGTCGSGGGERPGRPACELFVALVVDAAEGRITSDAEFIERIRGVADAASDVEGPIGEQSAALAAAAAALDGGGVAQHSDDLAQACAVAGHWPR